MRHDNKNIGESVPFERRAQHDNDAQDSAKASNFNKHVAYDALNDRSIVFDSSVERPFKSTKGRSRTYPSTDDKFCTQDCSSRSYLPSNPEGHQIGSAGRW
jgi:hypothetical protein